MPIVKPGGCLKVSECTGAREKEWKVKKREAKKRKNRNRRARKVLALGGTPGG